MSHEFITITCAPNAFFLSIFFAKETNCSVDEEVLRYLAVSKCTHRLATNVHSCSKGLCKKNAKAYFANTLHFLVPSNITDIYSLVSKHAKSTK